MTMNAHDGPPAKDVEKEVQADRAPYVKPVCEHLGAWRAVTLQQSVPVGGFILNGGTD